MAVPFLSLAAAHQRLRSEIMRFFRSFYDSGQYILGVQVQQFEEEFAHYCDARFCVGVGCGLDALVLALRALGVGHGDEVIVPSNTYIATWMAVSRTGATIVPVEPDPATSNLDPARVEAVVTERTSVILPVHLYGQACAMDEIGAIAGRHGVAVVEDNAQAHGAHCIGRPTGGLGTINATSFYPTKNLGALGDAGAVTTNDRRLADRVRALRNYGASRKNHNEEVGINSRLDELQAGILRIKLRHLESWNQERRRIAASYMAALEDVDGLVLPSTAPQVGHVYHLFVVRTPLRDELREALATQGIGSAVHYPVPPHLQPAYSHLGFRAGDFPIAEEIARTSLSLPFFVGMTEAQVSEVANAIKRFQG